MAKYDSFSKKNRRLIEFDYRLAGLYFVTICTEGRAPFFGEVLDGKMVLSDEGQIVHEYWLETAQHSPHVLLGEFVVMPNHLHAILGLEETKTRELHKEPTVPKQVSKEEELPQKNEFMAAMSPKAGSLSRIIGGYKTACTKAIRSVSTEPFGWQPRFHDRIIRNQRELIHIENYIRANPANWPQDQFYQPKKDVPL